MVLGITARSVRFLLRFPLWEDESFLCVNLATRGYLELLGPLEYDQVAPFLFLWVQSTLVKLFGFSEFSLRLFSFACGIGSLFLFRHLASRLLRGGALLTAVAVFAVSYAGIRYSAEAKPYGSDLFVSLVMLALTIEWCRSPENFRWLWGLTAFLPVAIALSYPAVFVAGGMSLVAACVLWTRRQTGGWLPWLVYNLVLVGSFLGVFALAAGRQSAASLGVMHKFWEHTFPPLSSPWELAKWLVVTHSSEMMAYPIGGERGASTATLVCVVVGLAILLRRKRVTTTLWCLSPLFLTFVAACLHRYPYGGHVRLNLYMMPIFSVLAGLGGATALSWLVRARRHAPHLAMAALAALALVAVGSIARDVWIPYKTESDLRARAFAQWFWFNMGRESELVCLQTDWHLDFSPRSKHPLNFGALYRCNLRIYSPRHRRGLPPQLECVAPEHPLRCVRYRAHRVEYDEEAFARWLGSMESRYDLAGRDTYPFPRFAKGEKRYLRTDYLDVYTFVPKASTASADARARRPKRARRP